MIAKTYAMIFANSCSISMQVDSQADGWLYTLRKDREVREQVELP